MSETLRQLEKREVGFILIIIAALIGVGYFAWVNDREKSSINDFETCVSAGYPVMESYPEQCTAFGQTHTKQIEKYSDSTGRFEISYPTTLRLEEQQHASEGPEPDWATTSRPFRLKPLNAQDGGINLLVLGGDSEALATQYKSNWEEGGHPIEAVKVGEYDADFARVVFEGDAEQYADQYWLIYHFDQAVLMTYREYHHHDMSGTNFEADEYFDDFKQTVESIRFID